MEVSGHRDTVNVQKYVNVKVVMGTVPDSDSDDMDAEE